MKDIVGSLFELWNLMDSPNEERNKFSRIASVLGSSESEIVEPGILSTEIIDQVGYLPCICWFFTGFWKCQ